MPKILLLWMSSLLLTLSLNAAALDVAILYMEQTVEKPPVLSNTIESPSDLGLQGAKLAIKDSLQSAKFLNQSYHLEELISSDEAVLLKGFEDFVTKGGTYIILNVELALFEKLQTYPNNDKVLFINAGLTESFLRTNYCKQNLLHTIASDAMLYDGLMQFLVKRNYKKLFLIQGSHEKDKQIALTMRHSAKKFGLTIVKEKTWDNKSDIRRKAQDELPVFTQGGDYDILLIADNFGDFGEFVYFNSWLPRPVAGTQGLTPVTWHKVIEQWGAAQMQSRFEAFSSRWMESKDFAAWVGVRTIVNALMHTNSADMQTNLNYIYSDEFELAAYLGRKLSYRSFNGQIRMPIALVQPRALISTSPQVGFLHPITDLDTLGINEFEMKCKK